mgnify:FL=1
MNIGSFLSLAAGPILGAVIGLGTNYLAVKMLFRPLYPKKLFGIRLPFTPGIIPKRKAALAHAIGAAVGEQLFTAEDIEETFRNPKTRDTIIQEICRILEEIPADTAIERIGDQLSNRLTELQIGQIIAEKGAQILREKAKGSMFALNDRLIQSIAAPIGSQIEDYLRENRDLLLRSVLSGKRPDLAVIQETDDPEKIADEDMLLAMQDSSASSPIISLPELSVANTQETDGSLLSLIGISHDMLVEKVSHAYDSFLTGNTPVKAFHLDVAGTVERKINAMDVKELENLVLFVMRKELRSLVWLGGLLGFLLGLLNLLW